MFKKKLILKSFKGLVLSVTERIESFFNYLKNLKNLKNLKKQNKTINKNLFIGISAVVILLLSYFLIPTFYDEKIVKIKLKNQILEKYNLEVKFEKSLKYSFFPKPHFYTNDATLTFNKSRVARSDNLKIYISKNNFFFLENLNIHDLIFKKTEFNITKDNFVFFKDLLNSNKSDYNVNFINSKFFYKDQNDDVKFFTDIKNFNFLYNKDESDQVLRAILKIFNTQFKLKIFHNFDDKKYFAILDSHNLRLNIENIFDYSDKKIKGKIDVKIINQSIKINYIIDNNSLIFDADKLDLKGTIDLKPFYLKSNIKLKQINFKKILENDSILLNLLNSGILNNPNLSANININSNVIKGANYLNNISLRTYFEEGNIEIRDSFISWNDSIIINFENTKLINENNKIIIVGKINLDFKDINDFYKKYQIKKTSKKNTQKIRFDFFFDVMEKKIEVDNLKIDENVNDKIVDFLLKFNIKQKNILNKVVIKNFIKEFFEKL